MSMHRSLTTLQSDARGQLEASGWSRENILKVIPIKTDFKMPPELDQIIYDLVDAIPDLVVRYRFIHRLAKLPDGYYSGYGTTEGHRGWPGSKGMPEKGPHGLPYCPYCGWESDPDCCHCGISKDCHSTIDEGHCFIPAGCTCGYADADKRRNPEFFPL